jgi:hypothetical protein
MKNGQFKDIGTIGQKKMYLLSLLSQMLWKEGIFYAIMIKSKVLLPCDRSLFMPFYFLVPKCIWIICRQICDIVIYNVECIRYFYKHEWSHSVHSTTEHLRGGSHQRSSWMKRSSWNMFCILNMMFISWVFRSFLSSIDMTTVFKIFSFLNIFFINLLLK